jgi:hypothetical protein
MSPEVRVKSIIIIDLLHELHLYIKLHKTSSHLCVALLPQRPWSIVKKIAPASAS